VYLQEWIIDPNFPKIWRLDKKVCGSGALGDLGAHVLDLARFLVGEPTRVMGMAKTFVKQRPLPDGSGIGEVDVDDAFISLLEFDNGAIGTVEASRFCQGRKNFNSFEINGEKGSIQFNLERLSELNVFWAHEEPKETRGFHTAQISEQFHPFMSNWWPSAHHIGWEHTFVHEFDHFFRAIIGQGQVAPYGATFEDGYRNAVICDAILESAATGKMIDIRY
jgi:predicted dehydrogenase